MCIQGSWKQSLRNSFKNFRRDHPLDGSCQPERKKKDTSLQPPSKRQKTCTNEQVTEDEYEAAVKDLQDEWKKGRKGRNQGKIKELMETTLHNRRCWIIEERPLVSQVISKFPALKQSRMVRLSLVHSEFSYTSRVKTTVE